MQPMLHQDRLRTVPITYGLLQKVGSKGCSEDCDLHEDGTGSLPQAGSSHDLPSGSMHNCEESSLYDLLVRDRNLHQAGSIHNLHDDSADMHSQSALHNLQLDRRVQHSSCSLHGVQDCNNLLHQAGSLHNMHDDSADMHSQSALHRLPSGLRNSHGDSHQVRSSPGLCHHDTMRSTRCLPSSADLL